MRRIALLWLVLTPLWIGFSFYASTSKIAFVPPALVVIAALLHWLHKRFVIAVAGEPEPRAKPMPTAAWPSFWPSSWQSSGPSRRSQAAPSRPAAAPLHNLVRPALIAVAVGACFGGGVTAFFHLHRPVANHSAAAHETQNDIQPNAIAVQTEAMKPQSLAAEPKALPTQAVKPQVFAAGPTIQDNSDIAGRGEAQISADGQMSNQPRCNVSLCESSYQSFRASDCTYQPYSGPRQYCAR